MRTRAVEVRPRKIGQEAVMNLRKATGRIVLVGLSAFLLLACGLSWAQKDDEKNKNEKSSKTHTSKPASKPASPAHNESSRPSTSPRPSNNNEVSRGTNTNSERGGNSNSNASGAN